MKGIYKLVIGGKFYIGRAENLFARSNDHKYAINRGLLTYPNLKSPHYAEWCRYLLENPKIDTIKVIALQRCIRDSMLFFAERYYLNEYGNHPDYLNLSIACSRPKCFFGAEDKVQVVTQSKRYGWWYYEDPFDGCSITKTDEELTINGLPRKR